MWIENRIYKEDLDYVCSCNFINWGKLKNKTILITGATGLIGSTIINSLLYYSYKNDFPLKVLGLVRDIDKSQKMFENQLNQCDNLSFISGDVCNCLDIPENVDYIIHTACPTRSKFFVENPVETIETIVNGTNNILKLAKEKQISGFVYLSSMEVYGTPETDEKISELHSTNLDVMSVRTSYPEAKRMAECLCASYSSQYRLPIKVIRLTQTFGPGVTYNDTRVFAEFARCAIEKKILFLKQKVKQNGIIYIQLMQ